MSDIFISYSSEDRARAKNLAVALEAEGWTVWWDRSIPTGQRYHRVIETELAAARSVVVLWSASSVDSDWVRAEAGEGMARGILVPISIDNSPAPLVFRQIQTAALSNWQGDRGAPAFRRLADDLAALIGPSPATTVGLVRDVAEGSPGNGATARVADDDNQAVTLKGYPSRPWWRGARGLIGIGSSVLFLSLLGWQLPYITDLASVALGSSNSSVERLVRQYVAALLKGDTLELMALSGTPFYNNGVVIQTPSALQDQYVRDQYDSQEHGRRSDIAIKTLRVMTITEMRRIDPADARELDSHLRVGDKDFGVVVTFQLTTQPMDQRDSSLAAALNDGGIYFVRRVGHRLRIIGLKA